MLIQGSYLNKSRFLLLITIVGVLTPFLFSPVKQNPNYHSFADSENLWGINNFNNVISNIPFVIAGLWGLFFIANKKLKLKLQYVVFFAGILVTGLGSMHYHFNPINTTLFWDRLPMTITFMSLLSILISEYINEYVGKKLLLWLLITGFISILYWRISEIVGKEDLRPYIVIQFLPLVLCPIILVLYPGKDKKYFWSILLIYIAAKISESYDDKIFTSLHFVSGHTIKHIIASTVTIPILLKIKKQMVL